MGRFQSQNRKKLNSDYEYKTDHINKAATVVEDRDVTVNNEAETIVSDYYEAGKVSYIVPVTIFVILLFVCVTVTGIIIHYRWKAKYIERILNTSLHMLATEKLEAELELLNKYK